MIGHFVYASCPPGRGLRGTGGWDIAALSPGLSEARATQAISSIRYPTQLLAGNAALGARFAFLADGDMRLLLHSVSLGQDATTSRGGNFASHAILGVEADANPREAIESWGSHFWQRELPTAGWKAEALDTLPRGDVLSPAALRRWLDGSAARQAVVATCLAHHLSVPLHQTIALANTPPAEAIWIIYAIVLAIPAAWRRSLTFSTLEVPTALSLPRLWAAPVPVTPLPTLVVVDWLAPPSLAPMEPWAKLMTTYMATQGGAALADLIRRADDGKLSSLESLNQLAVIVDDSAADLALNSALPLLVQSEPIRDLCLTRKGSRLRLWRLLLASPGCHEPLLQAIASALVDRPSLKREVEAELMELLREQMGTLAEVEVRALLDHALGPLLGGSLRRESFLWKALGPSYGGPPPQDGVALLLLLRWHQAGTASEEELIAVAGHWLESSNQEPAALIAAGHARGVAAVVTARRLLENRASFASLAAVIEGDGVFARRLIQALSGQEFLQQEVLRLVLVGPEGPTYLRSLNAAAEPISPVLARQLLAVLPPCPAAARTLFLECEELMDSLQDDSEFIALLEQWLRRGTTEMSFTVADLPRFKVLWKYDRTSREFKGQLNYLTRLLELIDRGYFKEQEVFQALECLEKLPLIKSRVGLERALGALAPLCTAHFRLNILLMKAPGILHHPADWIFAAVARPVLEQPELLQQPGIAEAFASVACGRVSNPALGRNLRGVTGDFLVRLNQMLSPSQRDDLARSATHWGAEPQRHWISVVQQTVQSQAAPQPPRGIWKRLLGRD